MGRRLGGCVVSKPLTTTQHSLSYADPVEISSLTIFATSFPYSIDTDNGIGISGIFRPTSDTVKNLAVAKAVEWRWAAGT